MERRALGLLREVEQSLDPTGFSRVGLGCSPAHRVSVAKWNELVSLLNERLFVFIYYVFCFVPVSYNKEVHVIINKEEICQLFSHTFIVLE